MVVIQIRRITRHYVDDTLTMARAVGDITNGGVCKNQDDQVSLAAVCMIQMCLSVRGRKNIRKFYRKNESQTYRVVT